MTCIVIYVLRAVDSILKELWHYRKYGSRRPHYLVITTFSLRGNGSWEVLPGSTRKPYCSHCGYTKGLEFYCHHAGSGRGKCYSSLVHPSLP